MLKNSSRAQDLGNSLRSMSDLPISGNPRADKADITNAQELFGDPFGDVDYGDSDFEEGDSDYGDADDFGDMEGDVDYGDVVDPINDDTASAYRLISGDPTPRRSFWRRYRNIGLGLGAAGLTAGALSLAMRKARARKARRNAIRKRVNTMSAKQTLKTQRVARQAVGKINRDQKMPFFQVIGAKMNSSPIDAMERFVADMFKHNLDRQASDTPFFQETAIGAFAVNTWTCTATGTASNRFYTALILQIGINQLNAAPGTIFTVTATLPIINGTLVVSATPWIFTIENTFDCRFIFFPWQLVSNRPLPVLGQYSNAAPIIVAVTGLPAQSAVNLVVPGSLHPWTIAMRNALI